MTTAQKRVLEDYVRSALTGFLSAFAFFALTGGAGENSRSPFSPENVAAAILFGVPVGIGIILCNRTLFPLFRRLPFLANLLCISLGYLLVVSGSFLGGLIFFRAARYGINVFNAENLRETLKMAQGPELRIGGTYAYLSLVFVTFWTSISRKMGQGVLRNWLLGKYRHPREEARIFLFLDVKGSTGLAETLGDLKFSGLLRDFFNDLTLPLLETKGEVSHYIGDAAVLTWRMRRGITGENPLRFFALLKREIEKQSGSYRARYGVVPEFKAGAHCGNVIATEVGDLKSEIVFHGDVLNTVSRVQGYCNELEQEFLVTGDLVEITPPSGFVPQLIGEFPLRGKSGEISIYAVEA